MLTLTDAAGACLADRLAKKGAGGDEALRFLRRRKRHGWMLRLAKPGPTDATFSHDGRIVLVLDEQSSKLLNDRMLDIKQTDKGPRLRLRGL